MTPLPRSATPLHAFIFGLPTFLALLWLPAPLAIAQQGDLKDPPGMVQAPPPEEWDIPPAPVLSAEEALKTFTVPEGFRVEIVASDPLIHDPVAMDIDEDGRLWVVEMQSYMPNPDGEGEIAETSRIVVLEDTDKNGRMDKATTYMDKLILPRAIKVLSHGVLVAEPPNLWYTRDTDGDGRADAKVSIDDHYSERLANPEHGGNGLFWGRDNWIDSVMHYGGQYRYVDGKWVNRPAMYRGQWGMGLDDYGRVYSNSNSDYLRADIVPPHYYIRNPNLNVSGRRGGEGVYFQLDKDQEVWPSRVTPGVNRGYRPNNLREDGTLRLFTAACGPMVYRGDQFPAEYYGNAFIAEPAAHLIRRAVVAEENGLLSAKNPYDQEEFFTSTDERFRPVNIYNAPDGTLYVVDLYRGILQHKMFLTTYLRQQIEERGLDKPVGLGRIYRIVHEGKKPGPQPKLSEASIEELVETLSHPNGWWRDTAQRLLVERDDADSIPLLRELARSAEKDYVRHQALWTLEGIEGGLDEAFLLKTLEDSSPKVRAAVVRLAEPYLQKGLTEFTDVVLDGWLDPSYEVHLQLALSAGEAQTPKQMLTLGDLAERYSHEPFMVTALISSLPGREVQLLEYLVADSRWQEFRPGYDRLFTDLASAVVKNGDADQIYWLFRATAVTGQPQWRRLALLNGAKESGVTEFKRFPDPLLALQKDEDPAVRKLAAGIMKEFTWPEKEGAQMVALTAEEEKLIESGRQQYQMVCAACHQMTGQGIANIAPALVQAKYATAANAEVPIRVVLKGKEGATLAMPPLQSLDDAQIAGVLSFVRNSWGNKASVVTPEQVAQVRKEIQTRQDPFSNAELDALLGAGK